MITPQQRRSIEFASEIKVAVIGSNRSTYYAKHWLALSGNPPVGDIEDCNIIITDGLLTEICKENLIKNKVVIPPRSMPITNIVDSIILASRSHKLFYKQGILMRIYLSCPVTLQSTEQ